MSSAAQTQAASKAKHHVRSTPDNVSWGLISAGAAPALRIASGDTVAIDTVSQQGLTAGIDPVEFFGAAGIAENEVLSDVKAIYREVKRQPGAGTHVLTGPIYVDPARPGDMLEVRILDVDFRVGYGTNNSGPGVGAAPGLLSAVARQIIRIDRARGVALFSERIELPLAPFMGIMAVAPPDDLAPAHTRPPGAFGGNMDLKVLTRGATLYLPVFQDGAQFFTGDGHGLQGDGEVNGTAIEISLMPTLQFIVHPGEGRAMRWPRAEDAACHYVMAMSTELDEAARLAVVESVAFLEQRAGVSAAQAYALASLSVDFRIAEAVNHVKVVYGAIPKRLLA
ncbi:MAG: acetamidase/formamidase family protein [Burkholderiales bacterium]|nr:acetamidase/formamidase family protein [Burkholderiales bacterium]